MFNYVHCVCVTLFVISNIVSSKYSYLRQIKGWIAPHKVVATWDEAFLQCQSEGAVLASPINLPLLLEMKKMISAVDETTSYFIGTKAVDSPRVFVSAEGINVDQMPPDVMAMITELDPDDGRCLKMDFHRISVEECTSTLPFICYKTQHPNMTDCGTLDRDYRFYTRNTSCYKVHTEAKSWDEALKTCLDEGAYLVIINDEVEANLILSNNMTVLDNYDASFIGLRDRNGDGDWKSIHGERVEQLYNKWYYGQKPSSFAYCAVLLASGSITFTYCNYQFSFICEKDPESGYNI